MAASSTKPVPDDRHTIILNLTVRDCAAAIDWYKQALGAQELMRIAPEGKAIWHAELRIGDSIFYLNDEMPGMGATAPQGADPVAQAVCMWVGTQDCDAAYRRAVEAGAKGTMPPADMFWGDRIASVRDPYGFDWNFATRVKEMTVDEMRRAGEEFAKQMASQQGR